MGEARFLFSAIAESFFTAQIQIHYSELGLWLTASVIYGKAHYIF